MMNFVEAYFNSRSNSVQNVKHHSNQGRSSGNMDTEFMYVHNVGLYSNQRRDSGCMETEFMSNQRRISGNKATSK